jgi:hypothetical protein
VSHEAGKKMKWKTNFRVCSNVCNQLTTCVGFILQKFPPGERERLKSSAAHAICRDVNYCKTSFSLFPCGGKSFESQGSFLSAAGNKFRSTKRKLCILSADLVIVGARLAAPAQLFSALMKTYIFQD